MIEKQISIDRIEVLENNIVQVRQAIRLIENGVELSKTYHRWMITPGQDYSDQDVRVKAICTAVHTDQAIAQWQEQISKAKNVG